MRTLFFELQFCALHKKKVVLLHVESWHIREKANTLLPLLLTFHISIQTN